MNSEINKKIPFIKKRIGLRGWMLLLTSAFLILFILFVLEVVLGLFGIRNPVRYQPVSSPDLFAHEDTLGWVLRPGASGVHVSHEFSVLYTIDSLGMRSTPASKRAIGPQIICLGGSMTFGHGLNDGQTFPNQLAELTGNSVWNLGVQGYATDQSLIQLQRTLRTAHPEIVILSFLPSHIERNACLPKWTSKLAISNRGKPRFQLLNGRVQLVEIPGMQASNSAQPDFDDEIFDRQNAGFFLTSENG